MTVHARSGSFPGRLLRVRELIFGQMGRTFSSIVTAQGMAAVFGAFFWVFAARLFSLPAVAAGSASVAMMLLIGSFSNMGLGVLLIMEFPRVGAGEQRRLLELASVVVMLVSGTVALAFALVAPAFSQVFAIAFADPLRVALFVVGCAATAVGLLTDRAVLGLGNNSAQVWRNVSASVVRFPIFLGLAFAGGRDASVLVGAWTAGLVIGQVLQYRVIHLPRTSGFSWQLIRSDIRRLAKSALGHHVLNVSLGLAPQLMPLLAAIFLVPRLDAPFNIVWTGCAVLFMVPYSMALTLLSTAAKDGGRISAHLKKTIRGGLALCAVCALAAATLGGPVLHLFRPGYAEHGAALLRILVLVAFPLVAKDHYFMIKRFRGELFSSAGRAMAGVALEVAAASVGAYLGGALGLCIGWLAAVSFEAILMLPLLVGAMRSKSEVAVA